MVDDDESSGSDVSDSYVDSCADTCASSSCGSQCTVKAIVPAVSNFSIQYNYVCASIATAIMLSNRDQTGEGIRPDYPEPQWAKTVLLSVVFIGSVVGMLTMGYLGDLIGIQRALVFTNLLTVLGALASALLSWGGPDTVWGVITFSRFVLGAGVGGNYPLSAAKAAETTTSAKAAVAKAAQAFFWQGPGSCAPYLLALALLSLPPVDEITSWQFRIILGAGVLPAFVVLFAIAQEPDSGDGPQKPKGQLGDALMDPEHWSTLVGTAGTWFLFDVAFYGMVIFAPTILENVFGADQSLMDLALHASFMAIIAIVGTITGVQALGAITPKVLAVSGLAIAAVLFVIFLAVFHYLPSFHMTLFVLLCSLYFVLYCGPNIATYILPVISFPQEVRSTFHGMSAAAAKVGAMMGALVFPVVHEHFGISTVMVVQAVLCAMGALLAHCCLENRGVADTDPDMFVDETPK